MTVRTMCGNVFRLLCRCATTLVCAAIAACLISPAAGAQGVKNYTVASIEEWMQKYAGAKPDFKPGDVLTAKDLERMRPFEPPGYLEQLEFPEFKMEIIAPVSHRPRQDYMDCSEKYQRQVRLKPDGTMANYVCGQPFPNSEIDLKDPTSGMKAAWNFEFKWQNYGLVILNHTGTWMRFGGDHAGFAPSQQPPPADWTPDLNFKWQVPADPPTEMWGGGGQFVRTLQGYYERTYLSHLAQLGDRGGTMNLPDAKDFEFKEFTGFFLPFDIRGTAFIVFRYSDPYRADDGWAYLPALRRVRRISVEVKSDSLLGTDHTIEDFYSFAGRELEWKWKFLGWKDVLVMMDSKYDWCHLYGPNGFVPDDVWSLRRFAVVERTPKDPRAPYSAVVNFWDAENWDTYPQFAFDRSGKLWKIWEYPKKWTETYKAYADANHGKYISAFQGVHVIDVQNGRGTIWPCTAGYPDELPSHVSKLFDINALEQIHR